MTKTPPSFSLRTFFTLLAVALLSSACVTPSSDVNTREPTGTLITQPPADLASLFEKARNSNAPEREQYLLYAVKQLRTENRNPEAQKILSSLSFSALPLTLKAFYITEYAEIALSNNLPNIALNALTSNQFNLFDYFDRLDPASQIQLSEIKARAYQAAGNFLASARERVYFNPLLNPENQIENEVIIWQNLNRLSIQALDTLAINTPTNEFRGWLELAHLNKSHQDSIDQQYQALNLWLARWSTHAGAHNLPPNLKLLSKYADLRPKKIALFLPLKGKLAKPAHAIQNGILAAHYTALQSSSNAPEIKLYDTSQAIPMDSLYQQALNEGAELIIGPLEKQHVDSILKIPSPAIPILALNYAKKPSRNPSRNLGTPTLTHTSSPTANIKPSVSAPHNIFQFGLLPEDDARQVALKAWQDGHKNVAILHPKSAWGARVSQAFIHYWTELGGQVVSSNEFDPKHGFSKPVKQLLNVDKSEQRARLLRRKLKVPLEFSVRRRKDIDYIFLLATPKQARQIKPTLAFYYANKVPVYATAHLYQGPTKSSDRDRDMNGIIFCDIPWMLETSDPVKPASLNAWPTPISRYERLLALGVDAYRLHPRLAILAAAPSSKVYGATGVLTLDDENRFQRNLLWAKIVKGKAQVIQSVDNQAGPSPAPLKNNDQTKRLLPQ